jgi:uncharacterized protein
VTDPVSPPERIDSLDVLRGFAVLGILVMNVQSFAMIQAAYFNPAAYGDLSGANYWVWLVSHLLADSKFMAIFSMLFGAGVVLMAGRATAGVHYRRMGGLLLFGLLHAYLLWYGDILVVYAICGGLAYLFHRLSPRTLFIVGVLLLAVASGFSVTSGATVPYWPEEDVADLTRDWDPPPEKVDEELAAYRGGWTDQMTHRAPTALEFHTFVLLLWGMWRVTGMMLLGMALFKLGILRAERSGTFYLNLVFAAVFLGLPVILFGVVRNFAESWSPEYSVFHGHQFNYWASLVVAFGWIGLVMLACRSERLAAVRRPFAAVGRMAFTCYLMQSIICTTIFYGHGFGLFGSVERTGQALIVLAVWAFLLIACPLWLRSFRFGPFEWLWRSMTYGKLQPFRKVRT